MNELPLRDIHLPSAVTWWPPAVGWWLLLFFSLGALVYVFRPTLRKRSLKLLRSIEKGFLQTGDAKKCVAELSLLLRFASVKRDESAAGLTGERWLQYLGTEFSQGNGKLFLSAPYQKEVDPACVSELLSLTRQWVRRL